jgi:glucose-1-phosphate cytidylyltransferase
MKAVILAGGFGTRISEEADYIPKPMVRIGERPILWHIMKLYSHFGINDFVLCLGYKSEIIKDYFVNYALHTHNVTVDVPAQKVEIHPGKSEPWRITMLETGLNTLTAGRIKQVKPFVGAEPFCMTYGDGLSNVDIGKLIAFHKKHGKKATVTAITQQSRFGVLNLEKDKVTRIQEKPNDNGTFINGGFFVLDPSVCDLIKGDEIVWERQPLEHLAETDDLMAYRHEGFWQPMDTLRDKRLLETMWGTGKAPWKVWKD